MWSNLKETIFFCVYVGTGKLVPFQRRVSVLMNLIWMQKWKKMVCKCEYELCANVNALCAGIGIDINVKNTWVPDESCVCVDNSSPDLKIFNLEKYKCANIVCESVTI